MVENKITVGSVVSIIDKGELYCYAEDFFDSKKSRKYKHLYKTGADENKNAKYRREYVVLYIEQHYRNPDEFFCVIQRPLDKHGQVFLIKNKGLKLLPREKGDK